jgi:hypothetical protein
MCGIGDITDPVYLLGTLGKLIIQQFTFTCGIQKSLPEALFTIKKFKKIKLQNKYLDIVFVFLCNLSGINSYKHFFFGI